MRVCPCGVAMDVGLACLGCGWYFCDRCLDVDGLCASCAEQGNEWALGPRREGEDEE